MRRYGFSTGALAKGDVEHGLRLQKGRCKAVELSALREHEIDEILEALPRLCLSEFEFVSFHAPSKLVNLSEQDLIQKLLPISDFIDGIIVHPDIMNDLQAWQALGTKLWIENMDQRKAVGRTFEELWPFFEALPLARFCFDVGHAHQIDPAQLLARKLIKAFASRLAEIHVSEVNSCGQHVRISSSIGRAFRRLASLIPPGIPVIIESAVNEDEIEAEIARAKYCFSPELTTG